VSVLGGLSVATSRLFSPKVLVNQILLPAASRGRRMPPVLAWRNGATSVAAHAVAQETMICTLFSLAWKPWNLRGPLLCVCGTPA